MRRQPLDVLAVGAALRDFLFTLKAGTRGIAVEPHAKQFSLSLGGKHAATSLEVALGGSATNAAVACARLGLRTGLVCVVGRDDIGEEIVRELKRQHVDTTLVSRVSLEQTGVSVILLDEASGEQTCVYVSGANRLLEITEDVQQAFHTTSWVYVTSLWEDAEDNQRFLLDALSGEKTRLALAPGGGGLERGAERCAALLERTALLAMNDREAALFLGEDVRAAADPRALGAALQARGPEIVLLTRGEQGAVVVTVEETLLVHPRAVSVVDTIGAGDAFAATFVSGLHLTEGNLKKAAQYAAANAASVVGTRTAQKGLLTRAMLDERVRENPARVEQQSSRGTRRSA